jgi:hypothetical protein
MKSFIKTTLTILVLFYIFNIVLYFAYIRPKTLHGIETFSENPDVRQKLLENNITMQDLINQTSVTDHKIFNPAFNIAYSIANSYLLVPSLSIVILIFILYKVYIRKKQKTIANESSTGVY